MRLTQCLFQQASKYGKRRRTVFWNNKWQEYRERRVRNLEIEEKMLDRGINVRPIETLFSPFLPEKPEFDEEAAQERDPVREAFATETEHPLYKERPAHTFHDRTTLAKGMRLDQVKTLTKTVEIMEGLPLNLLDKVREDLLPGEDRLVEDVVREAFLCDSTQKLLPRTVAVPYIGWHPVNDKMHNPVPYPVTHSWGRLTPREYGIPMARRNMNLLRGMLRVCDLHVSDHASLLDRAHLEGSMLRQFFEREGNLVRFYMSVPFVVTDPKPLPSFASKQEIEATKDAKLPNLYPMSILNAIWPKHVYRHENNFPIMNVQHSAPNVIIGCELDNNISPYWDMDTYSSRALSKSFLLALGQARLKYGPDVSGVLPEPVTVQFVASEGKRFHFSAFQLNTLDLDSPDGVKNIFWKDSDVTSLFEVCQYVRGLPTLEGFSPLAFRKLRSMYLQNV